MELTSEEVVVCGVDLLAAAVHAGHTPSVTAGTMVFHMVLGALVSLVNVHGPVPGAPL